MHVYDWLTEVAVSEYAFYMQIDLQERRLVFREVVIIDKGELTVPSVLMPDGSIVFFSGIMEQCENPYEQMESLYAAYKRSVPGKHERLNKGNFKALSSDALSYEELTANKSRWEARLLLEGFIVCGASAGLIRWTNPRHFFWQGNDPDLIVYREWII